jgi:Flp pilus assembly protein TadD
VLLRKSAPPATHNYWKRLLFQATNERVAVPRQLGRVLTDVGDMRHLRLLSAVLVAGCTAGVPLPPAALSLNNAGIEALARGDLETADARFSVALEYSPRFVDALVNLGIVEMQRGNFARARQLLERARRINPDVAQPHHGLGVLAERERRADRASEHYYEALRVDPGFAPARSNLARLLFGFGQVEEALVQYQRLVEVAPDDPVAFAGLAETLVRLGRTSESDAVLARASLRFPDAPELALLDARRSLRSGDAGAALVRLEPLARRRDEVGAQALAWTAAAELSRGELESAVAAARTALRLDPEGSVATYVLAVCLARGGSPDAAPWVAKARRLGLLPP